MFYSETILSRRGPLGRVWLAAHMERKLSKAQTLQTDIEQSVDAIMGQEVEVMALRLSGQLLLGVVRIYNRKAKYLLDDCNDALLKIKMAFRPGVVDMTEDQLAVNKNAITLQMGGVDLDLLPDVNWQMDFEDRPIQPLGQHQARIDDITLKTIDDVHEFDLAQFDVGPSDGIGSQDFDVDLGLDWEYPPAQSSISAKDDEMSVDDSVGVGRDASGHRESIGSHLLGRDLPEVEMDILSRRSKTREPSEHPLDVEMALPDLEGIDLGIGFDDVPLPDIIEKTPGQTRASSRASSPLSEPPVTPPPDEPIGAEMPPQPEFGAKRKLKEQKQVIDAVTELQDGPGPRIGRGRGARGLGSSVTQDVSNITTEQRFLPRSAVLMRLRAIRDDPHSHFLPTQITSRGTFFCAAPPGLAPELASLFLRPVGPVGQSEKRRSASPEKSPVKRPRLVDAAQGEDDVEQARRAGSFAPSQGLGSDILGRRSVGSEGFLEFGDQSGAIDDPRLAMPDYDVSAPAITGELDVDLMDTAERGKLTPLSPLSRLTTPGPDVDVPFEEEEEMYADVSCPIAMFDGRQSQSQTTDNDGSTEQDGSGYSKNTVKAIGLLRQALKPVVGQEEVDRMLSFRRVAEKASRRSVASFFFELLVLATRDCLRLNQNETFGNIEIRARQRLWEQQRHMSVVPLRGASAARSIGSALGL